MMQVYREYEETVKRCRICAMALPWCTSHLSLSSLWDGDRSVMTGGIATLNDRLLACKPPACCDGNKLREDVRYNQVQPEALVGLPLSSPVWVGT